MCSSDLATKRRWHVLNAAYQRIGELTAKDASVNVNLNLLQSFQVGPLLALWTGQQVHVYSLATLDVNAQVDVARRDARFDEGRAGGQAQRGLGDVVAGVGDQVGPEVLDLGLGGGRADQHAVAPGAVHLLEIGRAHV